MAYVSAREMLSRFPVKMANGGSTYGMGEGIDSTLAEIQADIDTQVGGIDSAAIAAAAQVKINQQTALNQAMAVFNNAGGGQAGTNAVLAALEANGLTLQDLSTMTGVALTEIDAFLGTQAADNTVVDDTVVDDTVVDNTVIINGGAGI